MWKALKFFGRLLKLALWLAAVLFLGIIACLYCAERGLPDSLVQKIAERLSTDSLVCRIGRVTYSLRRGLTAHHVKMFPKRVAESAFIAADEVSADFALLSLAPLGERLKRVTVKGIEFPALPPKRSRDPDAVREMNVSLPDIAPFELVLEGANILGLQAERITATVASSAAQASATGVAVKWPDRVGEVGVTGHVTFDCETKRIIAAAQGQVFPHLITPLLLGLRAKSVVREVGHFQDFSSPVAATYTVDVELTRVDYAMTIGIDAADCTYRGVPVARVTAAIAVTDTNNLVIADIGPISGQLKSGSLSGRLVYRDDDDSLFIDAQGVMPKASLLDIINVLNRGELDRVQCETDVTVSAKGVVATKLQSAAATNDLCATVSFAKGSVLRIPLADVSCDLLVRGHSAHVDNIRGSAADGGKIGGQVRFAFPDYAASNTTFAAEIAMADMDFANLMCIAQTNSMVTGKVTGRVSLAGSAAADTLASLSGEGSLKIAESILARIPLFAGLTDWFARNIPGVSSVVNQSSARLDFTMTNGVAVTENMLIEGNVFSILGKGSYALDTDTLDMAVRVNILKEHTLAGQIARLITFPVTRLLLEFRLSGTAASPEWRYVTFVEKLVDAIF